jgi:DNA-binding NarL/FixJ family response regulator
MALSVVIVDDHPTFRHFARRLLEAAGFDVVGEADDAATALAAVEALRPAAVLLDVLLPDRSGLEVARALSRGSRSTAVVLTSSRTEEDFGVALSTTPARGFIPKSELSAEAFSALVSPA